VIAWIAPTVVACAFTNSFGATLAHAWTARSWALRGGGTSVRGVGTVVLVGSGGVAL